jgi:hypothetical protein
MTANSADSGSEKKSENIDPMAEGHPEPFSQPRTIPGGWDLSDLIDPPHASTPVADMNGTAYEQNNPVFSGKKNDKAKNTVR